MARYIPSRHYRNVFRKAAHLHFTDVLVVTLGALCLAQLLITVVTTAMHVGHLI